MNKYLSKSGLFIIELIIAVFFFALSAGVCLTIFAKADQMSAESRDLTKALNEAQKAAECIKQDSDRITEVLECISLKEGSYVIYYDQDWNLISEQEKAIYQTQIQMHTEGGMVEARITVLKGSSGIYELEVKKYYG